MSLPSALIIKAPGTNRDGDVAFALELAGAAPRVVLTGELATDPNPIDDAQLLVIAGGFSHADALGAGRLFALELQLALSDRLAAFIERGRPVIGICNGFQALVRTGLLPGNDHRVALAHNESGHFQCRWVQLQPASTRCVWTAGLTELIDCPIAHGEGRLVCDDATFDHLVANDQIALTYWGDNPNGSRAAIAGICDSTGVVLGLMPHPEMLVVPSQFPRHDRRG
ncbi:MAG TPA: phosphoribosylformylglycinamidine synthase I, partial [Ilumatobacteraceae bacterium]|nr:phosphoribosylformylglycinamidine synthase I [Ilumatobacteraceae bacterium]